MIHVLAIGLLVVAFLLTTFLGLNLGALALVCTMVVGALVLGLPVDELLAEFPGDVFVILVGTTYLFTMARRNGAIDFLINRLVHLVGARPAIIMWIMFAVTGLLAALGSVFAVAMIAPVALALATRYRISPTIMGLLVVHGWGAGVLSPISVFGVIVNSVLGRAGIAGDPMRVFLVSAAANTVVAAAVFAVWLFRRTTRSEEAVAEVAVDRSAPEQGREAAGRQRAVCAVTLAALAALVVAVVGLGAHVGLTAFTCAFVLALVQPKVSKAALAEVPWSVVLLVCGVFTYIALLERIGTIDAVAELITASSTPTIAVLIACYVGAIVSAFASSTGIISAIIPLILPVLAVSDLNPATVAAALAVAMTIVDVSPLSTNGALIVANAPAAERDVVFRRLLCYGLGMAAVGPVLLWGAVVVIPA